MGITSKQKDTQTDCVKYEKYVPTDLCNYL